jgi:hypothetical protein
MEEMNKKTKTSDSTAVVMLNTRNIGGYQSLKEMQKPESKSLWGNQISFLQISIPKLSQSDPLEFVWKARKLIKRKRRSFGIHLIGLLLNFEMKLNGPEVCYLTINQKIDIFYFIFIFMSLIVIHFMCKNVYTYKSEHVTISIHY